MTNILQSTTVVTGPAYAANGAGTIDSHYHNLYQIKVPSYEFRVVEWTNEENEIVKVGLQVKENLHNQHGVVETYGCWIDVERVRMSMYV